MTDDTTTTQTTDTEETTPVVSSNPTMQKLLQESPQPPSRGDIIEGRVIGSDKSSLYVDLQPFGTGIIFGREFINARDMIKNINVGDEVKATVVDPSNEDGYIELSLKEARQALIWSDVDKFMKDKKQLQLAPKEANKGGLIIEWQGITGFLPASQLSTENYPRVEDGDKDKILVELQKLVGTPLNLTIIAGDPQENKLIFSEKGTEEKEKEVMVDQYSVGDAVEGEITGIVDFGVFIKVEDGLEGLAHISELDWGLVEDPRNLFKVGEKVQAKVIDTKDGKISLSIKALKENPWDTAAKKFSKDDMVEAVIIKYNKHGALASIEEGVAGLVHVSEFESMDKLREALELGKTYKFKINLFEPKEQRMTLVYNLEALNKKEEAKTEDAK